MRKPAITKPLFYLKTGHFSTFSRARERFDDVDTKESNDSYFNWNSCQWVSFSVKNWQCLSITPLPFCSQGNDRWRILRKLQSLPHLTAHLLLCWRSCIKPGNEIEGIGQNCLAAKYTSTDSDQSNASGTRFQRLSRTKWQVNILPLLGPTIFEPSQPISSMHLITETTSVSSNDKKNHFRKTLSGKSR